MSLINVSQMTFSYEGSYDDIFNNVSFQIDTAWKLGFCGRNGRGKTTFLKLLMGEFEYKGTISASVSFDYFPFAVADKTLDTMSILVSLAPEAHSWQIKKEVSKLKLSEDTLYRPFETLSHGEQTKALLAGLFLRKDNFLLIDEPTNHLDMEARATVSQYLNNKNSFIVVSHDRAFLDNCVNHILSINKTDIEVIKGNFSAWHEQKKLKDAYELAQNEQLANEISRLTEASERTGRWSDKAEKSKIGINPRKTEKCVGRRPYEAAKSAKLMKQAKNTERRRQTAADDKSKLLKNIETTDDLKIFTLNYHTQILLRVENLAITYGQRIILSGLTFSLTQGDRAALSGSNGSGKSSLLKLICGEKIPHAGLINIGSNLIISYVPQDTSFLSGSLKSYTEKHQLNETLFKSILRKLDFSRTQFDKDISDFSAGQKKKVLLAGSLCQKAHLYVWDEPLNYIDVISRIQIEELITTFKPTLLFVEHDRAFVDNIATKIIEL